MAGKPHVSDRDITLAWLNPALTRAQAAESLSMTVANFSSRVKKINSLRNKAGKPDMPVKKRASGARKNAQEIADMSDEVMAEFAASQNEESEHADETEGAVVA